MTPVFDLSGTIDSDNPKGWSRSSEGTLRSLVFSTSYVTRDSSGRSDTREDKEVMTIEIIIESR